MEKERKLQIIKAADKRFSKHGLGKTTLDEIARDLRMGKATIYHYFSSKEELFYKTVEWESAQFLEEIKAIFNNEQKDPGDRFIDYFDFKESIVVKYKLVHEIILILLKDESLDKEVEIIDSLIRKEEEIVSLAVSSLYANKLENMKQGLPLMLVAQSWGRLLSNTLLRGTITDKNNSAREIFNNLIKTSLP